MILVKHLVTRLFYLEGHIRKDLREGTVESIVEKHADELKSFGNVEFIDEPGKVVDDDTNPEIPEIPEIPEVPGVHEVPTETEPSEVPDPVTDSETVVEPTNAPDWEK